MSNSQTDEDNDNEFNDVEEDAEELLTSGSLGPVKVARSTEEDGLSELLAQEAREARRMEQRPDIDGLQDAVVTLEDGTQVFLPQPGQLVIVERQATSKARGRYWLDTNVYRVDDIDDETGDVKLYDPALLQHARTNFVTGTNVHGYRFKLPPKKGAPLPGKKRKRQGRSKNAKLLQEQAASTMQTQDAAGAAKPKRKGRPKGSKNRSKEEIAAEKQRIREERLEKKARKKNRR